MSLVGQTKLTTTSALSQFLRLLSILECRALLGGDHSSKKFPVYTGTRCICIWVALGQICSVCALALSYNLTHLLYLYRRDLPKMYSSGAETDLAACDIFLTTLIIKVREVLKMKPCLLFMKFRVWKAGRCADMFLP